MRVEDTLRVSIEQVFAGFEPLSGLDGESAAVEIQLFYLVEPAPQLFHLDVILFKLVVGEVLRGGFLGDFTFEIVAFVDSRGRLLSI